MDWSSILLDLNAGWFWVVLGLHWPSPATLGLSSGFNAF
jgi:hypothetical protein